MLRHTCGRLTPATTSAQAFSGARATESGRRPHVCRNIVFFHIYSLVNANLNRSDSIKRLFYKSKAFSRFECNWIFDVGIKDVALGKSNLKGHVHLRAS